MPDGRVTPMHEYRRFIQHELNARGWRQADLVRESGLSRQLVSSILRDNRDHLGQMPDAETIQAIATGFGVPQERVRVAAARSLADYIDDGAALTITLGDVSTDALLNEIKRRIDHAEQPATPTPQPRTPGEAAESEKTQAADGRDQRQADHDLAARDTGGISEGEQTRRDMDQQGEAPDPEGPEDGA